MNHPLQTDRRREQRYAVFETIYVYLPHSANIMAPIVDISMSGLSFHYCASGGCLLPPGNTTLTLLTRDGEILEGLPCTTIDDLPIRLDRAAGLVDVRRHSVRFATSSFSAECAETLRYFIAIHAKG